MDKQLDIIDSAARFKEFSKKEKERREDKPNQIKIYLKYLELKVKVLTVSANKFFEKIQFVDRSSDEVIDHRQVISMTIKELRVIREMVIKIIKDNNYVNPLMPNETNISSDIDCHQNVSISSSCIFRGDLGKDSLESLDTSKNERNLLPVEELSNSYDNSFGSQSGNIITENPQQCTCRLDEEINKDEIIPKDMEYYSFFKDLFEFSNYNRNLNPTPAEDKPSFVNRLIESNNEQFCDQVLPSTTSPQMQDVANDQCSENVQEEKKYQGININLETNKENPAEIKLKKFIGFRVPSVEISSKISTYNFMVPSNLNKDTHVISSKYSNSIQSPSISTTLHAPTDSTTLLSSSPPSPISTSSNSSSQSNLLSSRSSSSLSNDSSYSCITSVSSSTILSTPEFSPVPPGIAFQIPDIFNFQSDLSEEQALSFQPNSFLNLQIPEFLPLQSEEHLPLAFSIQPTPSLPYQLPPLLPPQPSPMSPPLSPPQSHPLSHLQSPPLSPPQSSPLSPSQPPPLSPPQPSQIPTPLSPLRSPTLSPLQPNPMSPPQSPSLSPPQPSPMSPPQSPPLSPPLSSPQPSSLPPSQSPPLSLPQPSPLPPSQSPPFAPSQSPPLSPLFHIPSFHLQPRPLSQLQSAPSNIPPYPLLQSRPPSLQIPPDPFPPFLPAQTSPLPLPPPPFSPSSSPPLSLLPPPPLLPLPPPPPYPSTSRPLSPLTTHPILSLPFHPLSLLQPHPPAPLQSSQIPQTQPISSPISESFDNLQVNKCCSDTSVIYNKSHDTRCNPSPPIYLNSSEKGPVPKLDAKPPNQVPVYIRTTTTRTPTSPNSSKQSRPPPPGLPEPWKRNSGLDSCSDNAEYPRCIIEIDTKDLNCCQLYSLVNTGVIPPKSQALEQYLENVKEEKRTTVINRSSAITKTSDEVQTKLNEETKSEGCYKEPLLSEVTVSVTKKASSPTMKNEYKTKNDESILVPKSVFDHSWKQKCQNEKGESKTQFVPNINWQTSLNKRKELFNTADYIQKNISYERNWRKSLKSEHELLLNADEKSVSTSQSQKVVSKKYVAYRGENTSQTRYNFRRKTFTDNSESKQKRYIAFKGENNHGIQEKDKFDNTSNHEKSDNTFRNLRDNAM